MVLFGIKYMIPLKFQQKQLTAFECFPKSSVVDGFEQDLNAEHDLSCFKIYIKVYIKSKHVYLVCKKKTSFI